MEMYEMGGVCRMVKMRGRLVGGNLRQRGEDTGIILKLSFRKYDRSVDCVGLAQGREK